MSNANKITIFFSCLAMALIWIGQVEIEDFEKDEEGLSSMKANYDKVTFKMNPPSSSGSDPMKLDYSADNNKETVTASINQVNFDFGKSKLTAKAKIVISQLIPLMQEDYLISVEGHTDKVGSHADNYELSLERAYSVKNYMDELKNSLRIKVIGYGELQPLVNTDSRSYDNRRVEIKFEDDFVAKALSDDDLAALQMWASIAGIISMLIALITLLKGYFDR